MDMHDSQALKRPMIEASQAGEPMTAKRSEETPPSVNGHSRTAADIAAQLGRDATSLTLTGENFEKDKAFYDGVAANLRDAADWLKNWEPMLEQMRRADAVARVNAVGRAYADCAGIAREIRDVVPENIEGVKAGAWRTATDAVRQAILSCAEVSPIGAR